MYSTSRLFPFTCSILWRILLPYAQNPQWVQIPKVLGYTSKMFPIHKEILGFLDVALAGYLSFSQFIKMICFFFFESKPRLYFQIFPNSPKIWETGIFEVPSYSHLLSLKPFSYSETMGWKQGWEISKEFCRKNIWFSFVQLKMYLH